VNYSELFFFRFFFLEIIRNCLFDLFAHVHSIYIPLVVSLVRFRIGHLLLDSFKCLRGKEAALGHFGEVGRRFRQITSLFLENFLGDLEDAEELGEVFHCVAELGRHVLHFFHGV
jgi:hypothetical protein